MLLAIPRHGNLRGLWCKRSITASSEPSCYYRDLSRTALQPSRLSLLRLRIRLFAPVYPKVLLETSTFHRTRFDRARFTDREQRIHMSKSTIAIHLPDGSVREVPAGTTPLEIANSISPRLAAASVVARLAPLDSTEHKTGGGEEPTEASMYAAHDAAAPRLVDLSTPLTEDARLQLITEKDAEALKVVRHSAAHVMATAVLELFPETKLGHGPATDAGFFYDFYREKPFTPEDLAAIEKRMAEVVERDEKFVHEFEPRSKALEVGVEILLREKRRAVDALQLRILLVTQPVCAGQRNHL